MAVALLAVLPGAALAQSAGAETDSEKRLGYSLSPSTTKPYTPCPPGGHVIECNIVIDPTPVITPAGYQLPGGGPLLEGGGELGGYDPKDLQSAYGIPTSGGTGETVALVDAYGYAAAESDLAKYREKYGLAACTKASGCFKKVNQKGEEKNYPAEGGELETIWSLEAALDMDMVSAACPNCHILLVEATTQEPKDTAASVEEAATLKATEISNSYGYAENNETWCPAKKGCKEYLSSYNHAGIPVTVSTGDSGFDGGVGAPAWPATSPNVIAVGGTTLNKAEGSRGWSEKVWSGGGSGCSLYESKPAWQSDPTCAMRMDSDIAAVADPNTPVSGYNTPAEGGWFNVGGTSVAAPLVAGIEAHANSATKTAAAEGFYKHPGMLFDVTRGSNGGCESEYWCHGEVGYDGPTGWGTPNGVPHLNGWFTRAVPNLAAKVEAKSSVLAGESCTTSGACTAVGHYLGGGGSEAALAEHWNGLAWSIQEMASPGGAKSSSLAGVACEISFSSEVCFAVGRYVNTAGTEVPLLEESVNGAAWSLMTVEAPKEAKGASLSGIACVSTSSCKAVGRYVNSAGTEVTLAEKVSFGVGTIIETPNPTGAKSSALSGVSCRLFGESIERCFAVGHYVNSTGTEVVLGERFFLTKWVLTEMGNPTGAKSSSLSSLSCGSGELCAAVGRYVNSASKEVTLAEQITASTNTGAVQETPNPTGAKSSSLSGVSCSSATTCTAVGGYVNSGGTEVTLAERWNGTTWSVQEPGNPSGAKGSSLAGVSCSTVAETCAGVGRSLASNSIEGTLAESWNGTAWSIQATPNPKVATGSLSSISCPTAEACTAVGHYTSAAGAEVMLAEGWNGKEWSFQETVTPTGAKSSTLTGVSCTSAEACKAVGHYVNSSGVEVTLAEVWASKKWALQTTVTPTGAKSSGFTGVSCTSAEACTAVGRYVNSSSVEVTLAERWNGTAWSVQETVTPTGAKSSSLSGVSCASSTACTAVGRYVNSASVEVTLAEGWNGTAWSIKETPNPTGAKNSGLSGVSCTSAEACTAVGRYVTSGGVEVTLAEAWASAKWAVQETPNPEEATASSLAGVSCHTAETCIAGGDYSAGGEMALVEEHA